MAKYKIALIRGDGIGPEVIAIALEVLRAVDFDVEYVEIAAGLDHFRKTGRPLEEGAIDTIRSCDALLKGPLTTPVGWGYSSVNVALRRELGLFANIRPFRSLKGISLHEGLDVILIRENTEGLYSGSEIRGDDSAVALRVVTRNACERLCRFAFEYAVERGRRKVTAVHKANILRESDGLFRRVFFEVAKGYAGIEADELLVDAAAYKVVVDPSSLDVMVTPNLYGDILSDELAGIVGSIGLCGSAQIGVDFAAFEPVHGTAPDIAGKGVANPIGAVISASLMLEWLACKSGDESLAEASRKILKAVERVLELERVLTPDLGGTAKTEDVERALLEALEDD